MLRHGLQEVHGVRIHLPQSLARRPSAGGAGAAVGEVSGAGVNKATNPLSADHVVFGMPTGQ